MSDGRPRYDAVLIVEDEPLVRMLAADALRDAGYEVVEASNAIEAITIIGTQPEIRLLFTDVNIPGGFDGLQLAELVHQKWPFILLLLTSGRHSYRSEDMPDDGHFLSKPYQLSSMVATIRGMLQGGAGKPQFFS